MPSGLRLHGVADVDAPLIAVAQEGFETRHFGHRGDNENVANAGKHQRGQRIIDHRLVVDRQQLFGADHRNGHSHDPVPPARMMPFRQVFIALKRGDRLFFNERLRFSQCV